MHEVKFRGMTEEGEWVYGWYFEAGGCSYILPEDIPVSCGHIENKKDAIDYLTDFIEVIPESIGQYTGLKDKNGKEIYKGDIVKIMTHREYESSPSTKDKYRTEVVTNGCRCGLNTNSMISTKEEGQEEYIPQMEIIGNTTEHPGLLK